MTKQILYLITFTLLLSCNYSASEKGSDTRVAGNNNSQLDTIKMDTTKLDKQKINLAGIKPVFGYRFTITGDFDGNGIQEVFKEHFYSNRDHKETNKFFSGIDDVWILYDSVEKRDCSSYLLCGNSKFDTIPVGGIFGPLWLKNEGDLDKDGKDEISYVQSLPQQSSFNHCNILSFKNGKWKEIYSFEIREWQIPPLPQGGKTYGLMGMDGSYMVGDNDSINKLFQKEFNDFPGFIIKLKSGKIKVQTFTPFAEDTTLILDLTKHPKRYN